MKVIRSLLAAPPSAKVALLLSPFNSVTHNSDKSITGTVDKSISFLFGIMVA